MNSNLAPIPLTAALASRTIVAVTGRPSLAGALLIMQKGALLAGSERQGASHNMPTPNEFWTIARRVASERGGLVVGFTRDSTLPELGSTLDNVLGFTLQAPATVVSVTDWTDWTQQMETFYRLCPGWGRGKAGDPDASYYRIKFEESSSAGAPSFSSRTLDFNSSTSSTLDIPSFGGYAAPLAGFRGVTFWPRLSARLLDIALHYGIGYLAGLLFAFMLIIASGGHPAPWIARRLAHSRFPSIVGGVLGLACYHVICTAISGSTIGKLIFGMQVIQDDGSPCRLKSAVIRELGYFVDALFFGVVAYFAMQDDPEQKRVGDGWADTIVVKRGVVPLGSRQGAMRFVLGLMLGVIADIAFLMMGLLVQMNS